MRVGRVVAVTIVGSFLAAACATGDTAPSTSAPTSPAPTTGPPTSTTGTTSSTSATSTTSATGPPTSTTSTTSSTGTTSTTSTTVVDLGAATGSFSFAFISDTPTGSQAVAWFPLLVDQVNADPDVAFVAHAGDVRGGDTDCSDASLQFTFDLMQTFDDPFWYVPGDNEWADCHRNGGYLPTERLDVVRSLFFADPSRTTGGMSMPVESQALIGTAGTRAYVEHTRFARECVMFGALHVTGSGDDDEEWGSFVGDPAAGLAPGDQPDLRLAERTDRRSAALAWLDDLLTAATRQRASGVVVMMHAEPVDTEAYASVRAALVQRAGAFDGEVLLLHGDSHTYQFTPGYAGVPNLTRLEAPGDEAALNRWLDVSVTCDGSQPSVFSHELRFFDVPG